MVAKLVIVLCCLLTYALAIAVASFETEPSETRKLGGHEWPRVEAEVPEVSHLEETVRRGHNHSTVDRSVAGGGVILGGLATTFLVAVFCYIRATRKHKPNYDEKEKETPKVMLALWKACWGSETEREKETNEGLTNLEKELGDKHFFGGETIGFVDRAADFIGYWLGIVQEASGVTIMTAEKFPKLHRWSEHFLGNSIIKEVLPPKQKLVALFKAQFGRAIKLM